MRGRSRRSRQEVGDRSQEIVRHCDRGGVEGGTARGVEGVPGKVLWGDGPWRLGDLSELLKAPGTPTAPKKKIHTVSQKLTGWGT